MNFVYQLLDSLLHNFEVYETTITLNVVPLLKVMQLFQFTYLCHELGITLSSFQTFMPGSQSK